MVERVSGANTTQYLHRDQQGSVTKVTSSGASVTQALAYDAWGLRRNAADWSPLASPFAGSHETERGYTGHEHLDNVGLIHMNGRVQDPTLGRFVSADPFVQAPYHTQSHNRFSYVMNNPATLVDPSGFWWDCGDYCVSNPNNFDYDPERDGTRMNNPPPVTDGYIVRYDDLACSQGCLGRAGFGSNPWGHPATRDAGDSDSPYGFWSAATDVLQVGIGLAGQIPGWGEIADGANAVVSSLRGDEVGAAMDVASMAPISGNGMGAVNAVRRLGRLGEYAIDTARRARAAIARGIERLQSLEDSLLDRVVQRRARQRLGDLDAFASQRGGPRSRQRNREANSTNAALQQLEEIEEAQRRVRQGQSNQIIDSIEKSRQRARNALRPHNIDLENLDDF